MTSKQYLATHTTMTSPQSLLRKSTKGITETGGSIFGNRRLKEVHRVKVKKFLAGTTALSAAAPVLSTTIISADTRNSAAGFSEIRINDYEIGKYEEIMAAAEEAEEPAESDSDDFEYEELEDGTVSIPGYSGEETDVVIPGEIDGKSVTAIGDSAFENCTSFTSIEIPDSATSIGGPAFGICTSLTSVEIPDGVKSIEEETFLNCEALASAYIPPSAASIAHDASHCISGDDIVPIRGLA